jgi:DNA-binding transcriptional ArsR family regulator
MKATRDDAPIGPAGHGVDQLALTNALANANRFAMLQTAPLDTVMRALADPTRRSVFERIVRSDQISVAELTRGSGVTQGAISQHLKSLKQAGLVAERPQGRQVFYSARPDGLDPLFDWMRHYDLFWRDRFSDLRSLLKEIDP